MKAVILAAGKGVRMLPLTEDRPKVMIELNGKPFLWYVIENLKQAGIKDIGVVVGYRADKIRQYFGEKLKYIEQKEQLGTAHAVLQAKDFVGADDFILIMGDNLYSSDDIRELSRKSEFYVSAFRSDSPSAYGVLDTKGDMLAGIEEKPAQPKGNLVNTGLYRLTPEIFGEIMKLKKSKRGEYELTDALTSLAKHNKVRVYKLRDYWIDMSYKEQLPIIEETLKRLRL
jgi:dTDP-glucose pyrophosphorylase